MTERTELVANAQKTLTELFPNNGVSVHLARFMNDVDIRILYTHFRDEAQCNSKILENDPCYMAFAIYNDRKGFYIEFPVKHFCRVFDDGSVKFRKLSAKTEQECLDKLVKWFTKHQQHILNVGKAYEENR